MEECKRVLIKISGEGLMGESNSALDYSKVINLANQLKILIQKNIQVALVIGAGNIFRGKDFKNFGLSQPTADNMGMLATIFNSIAVSDIFKSQGIISVVFSALELNKFTEFYNVNKVDFSLNRREIVILAGGIANPFFTTDTAAIIRGAELSCCAVLKATQVDGVFDKDPKEHKDAKLIKYITFDEVIKNNLKVMDLQSIIIAKNTKIPIYIFNMHKSNSIIDALENKNGCSVISYN